MSKKQKKETFRQFDTEEEFDEYAKKELSSCDILKQLEKLNKGLDDYYEKYIENVEN